MLIWSNPNCSGLPSSTTSLTSSCTSLGGNATAEATCPADMNDDDKETSTGSPTASTGMTVPTPTSTGSDGDDEAEADAAEALALDVGPIGCLALHSAAGCAASTELQESCSCVSKQYFAWA